MKSIVISALVATAVFAAAPAMANKDLATKSGCLACHGIDNKMVGPAYKEIAKKYASDKDAEVRLINRVKKGTAATGGQVWKEINGGAVPMPATNIKDEDIKTLVKWILAGAK